MLYYIGDRAQVRSLLKKGAVFDRLRRRDDTRQESPGKMGVPEADGMSGPR